MDLSGNSIDIPDAILCIVPQDEYFIVQDMPASLQVKPPVTGSNVEVLPALLPGGGCQQEVTFQEEVKLLDFLVGGLLVGGAARHCCFSS